MISGKIYRVRLDPEFLAPTYVELYLQSTAAWRAIDRMKTGVSDSGLNLTQNRFRALQVPIAPRDEQKRIVSAVEEHFSRLDAAEATLRQTLNRLDTLRSSILVNAFCLNRELPRDWRVRTIGDVASVNPRMAKADIPDDLDVSFVPMAAVEEITGRIELANSRPAIELKAKSYRGFIDGDVLVAKITPSMENGKAAVASGLHNSIGFGSTEFHVLRPNASILAEYLFYFIIRKQFRAEAARHMTGTAGQLRVPAEFLRAVPIPTAPIHDQREIAETIEGNCSLVTNLEAVAGTIREKINSLRRSVLAAAFSGRLVPQDPDDEPASVLLERIAASRLAKPAHRRRTA